MDRIGRPTEEEVIAKLKDDGGFDTLRLKIIRKVKENEDLRNSIIAEVKQSVILNTDGSEDLKPRQLSDAIYQELGKKIMGQISDEVWKVIRSNDSIKDDIRGSVEEVYTRLANTDASMEDQIQPSPPNEQPTSCNNGDDAPFVVVTSNEPNEPLGLAEMVCDQQMVCLPSKEEVHQAQGEPEANDADVVPPGFSPFGNDAELQGGGVSDDDPDVPPGFG